MKKFNQLIYIILIYLACSIIKDIEFLIIKTDQTILAENIICKLFCILLIFVFIHFYGWKWSSLGFSKNGFFKGMISGFALGLGTFAVSYGIEILILVAQGKTPQLKFFITNFAISNQNVTGFSLSAVLICILGNIVNVWAEEGLFRGLFYKLGCERFSKNAANLIQAFLFGIWHIVTVVGWVLDGSMTVAGAAVMAVGYIVLAGILGLEWGFWVMITGTVWTGLFEHFFNNFISNALHVVTESGTDEMQIFRIVLSNILSLCVAIFVMKKGKKSK